MTLVRLSVLLLLRRIFDVKPFKIITSIIGAACIAWGVAIFFANMFQCTPFADAFDPEIVMGLSKRCIDLQAMYYGTLGTALILDITILALPLHLIWKLSLPTRKKLEIVAILSLGGMCVPLDNAAFTDLRTFRLVHISLTDMRVTEPASLVSCEL